MTKARKQGKPQAAKRMPGKSAKGNSSKLLQVVDTISAEAKAIDTIREIIFGRQMADYENRFAQLEDRLSSQIESIREQMANRLEETEKRINNQNDRLTERLNSEQSERIKEAEVLSREIVDVKKGLLIAVDDLAARQAQDIKSMKEQLTARANDLSDEIYIQQVEASKNLEQAVQGLDDDKLARKALSELLTEMAGRLTDTQE